MATTTNFGWETPDDTDLVKDGAAAIRTALGGVDTSFVDLKGGTTGQTLTKASGTDLDFTWAAAATSGSNWTLLNTGGTALTGAGTITVSGISGKDKILILFQSVEGGLYTDFGIQLNTDTGSNYYRYGQQFNGESSYSYSRWTSLQGAGTNIPLFRASSNGGTSGAGYVLLSGCNSSGVKTFNSLGAWNAAAAEYRNYQLGGYYNSASTISSVSIMGPGGNFTGGTIWVYTSA